MVPALQKTNLFKGKTVVITGGGSGIGLAAAEAFLKQGATVVLIGRHPKKLARAAAGLGGKRIFTLAGDVSKARDVQKLVAAIIRKYKKIDCLINCAGVYGPIGTFHTNALRDWKEAIDINLLGTVAMTHAVLPHMVKRLGGKIVNLSGGGGVQPFPNFSAYATSKAAVIRFTETVAKEYERYGIHCNAVAPGAINTSFLDKVLAAKEKAGKGFYKKSLEQKKSGGDSPQEAAQLFLFLCSSTLTGKLIAAKWDAWKSFTKQDVKRLNANADFTLRRIDNKYYFAKPK